MAKRNTFEDDPNGTFFAWSRRLRERLEWDGVARSAVLNLEAEGCERLSMDYLLWHYCGLAEFRTTALELRQTAKKFRQLAKTVDELARQIESANSALNWREIAPKQEDALFPTALGFQRLPIRLGEYAFFLEHFVVQPVSRFSNSRKWGKTDRLVLLATYVEAITSKKHYAELTHMLAAAFGVSGREESVDGSFISNTCRQYPKTNPLVDRWIKQRCAEYARVCAAKDPNRIFIQWLESKPVPRNDGSIPCTLAHTK